MNLFNRIVVVVLSIVAVVAGLIIAISPEALLAAIQSWTDGAVVTPSDRLASAILGIALAVAGAVVLYLDLRRRRESNVVVKRLPDGTVSIDLASIARRVKEAVEAVGGVRQAVPHVRGLGQSVAVKVDVLADTAVDIPEKSEEIGGVVRDAVAKMGIGLGRQTVQLRYEAASAKTSRPTP